MRIIAGKYKGRVVKFPKSDLVRPTTDRNKESIFNYLTNQIDFEGIKALDIYAGSGSLGLEALSRGASEVHFVEKDFRVSKMLEENISSLNAKNECKIFRMEALRFSKLKDHEKYNLILADPPFFQHDIHTVVKNLIVNNFLIEDGILLVERSIQTKEKDQEAFQQEYFRKLGDSLIYIFDNQKNFS
ncbi:MAG: 16S rRNA (guanine(966)-N(2))-methyltransferase RsmD [Melioribacteraceae bacterium]|nr:16S rRNA (guanine(966)-N(2))-methyltransferase RsmD [Melioribacteraceae bacterium]